MAQAILKEAVPSALELRDMLEEMAVRELRGPVQGDEEEVPGRIRDRYLVGILAPRQRAEDMPSPLFDTPTTPPAEDDDILEGDFPPGDEMAVEGSGRGNLGGDDGPTERSPSMSKAVFPSSLGLSFCVPLDVTALKVTPRWGRYDKTPSAFLTNPKTGTPKRVWKRQPCGSSHEIPLQAGPVGPLIADEAFPDARIKGLIRRRTDHWSVTLFLVNDGTEPPPPNRERTWMFQCELAVEAPDGSSVFHKRFSRIDLTGTDEAYKQEADMLAMVYRRHVEFAVGHGTAVHADLDPTDPNRAVRITTRAIPSYEIPRTTPPTVEDADQNPAFARLDGLVLDMKLLYETPQAQLRPRLEPLVAAYREWIGLEKAKIDDPAEGLGHFQPVARTAIERCERTLKRIEEGLDLLAADPQVADAFRFMNQAMWLQRTHSLFSEGVRRGRDIDYNDVDIPRNRSWYPFQLAFILLNLPGLTRLDHPDRGESPDAVADLLWFPTGGGKTEAYLGLTAYTIGLRRLQGDVAGRSGEDGDGRPDAVHAAAADPPAVPAGHGADLRLRGHPPPGLSTRRPPLGQDAVPHRPVGRAGARPPTAPTDGEEAIKHGHRQQRQVAARGHRRQRLAPPTDELPLVRLEDRLHAPLLPHRDRQQGPGPHVRLLRRQVRPVPLQQAASPRTRGCRSWWWTRRSTGGCRPC